MINKTIILTKYSTLPYSAIALHHRPLKLTMHGTASAPNEVMKWYVENESLKFVILQRWGLDFKFQKNVFIPGISRPLEIVLVFCVCNLTVWVRSNYLQRPIVASLQLLIETCHYVAALPWRILERHLLSQIPSLLVPYSIIHFWNVFENPLVKRRQRTQCW